MGLTRRERAAAHLARSGELQNGGKLTEKRFNRLFFDSNRVPFIGIARRRFGKLEFLSTEPKTAPETERNGNPYRM
jgi:hypothetical protein